MYSYKYLLYENDKMLSKLYLIQKYQKFVLS